MNRRLATSIVAILIAGAALASETNPGWLGMVIRWSPDSEGRRTMVVVSTHPKGPAAAGGVLAGDIIQTINGQKPDFGDDLDFLLFLAARVPGERLKVGIVREGKKQTVTVTVAALPAANRDAWNRGLAQAKRKRLRASSPPS
jgi:serine protease Do